jgi:WXG100 family type VII secretion target
MAVLRVDTEVMATSAGKIASAIEDIDNVLVLLNSDVNEMLGGWGGDAADAHRNLHMRFQDDASKIRNSLLEIYNALSRTHATYVTQEQEQSNDHVVAANQIIT